MVLYIYIYIYILDVDVDWLEAASSHLYGILGGKNKGG